MDPALSENQSSQAYRPLEGRRRADLVLPERLHNAIQDQQERSEVLISAIQLLIVFIFGLLYAIAPKTFSQEAAFAPVPWVLTLYLLFSLVRFYLAKIGRAHV